MIFVHEKGQAQLQYHTHLIIPALPAPINSVSGIQALWKHQILPRAKSLSRQNSLHAERVYDINGFMQYLAKEIKQNDGGIDYHASRLLVPSSSPQP